MNENDHGFVHEDEWMIVQRLSKEIGIDEWIEWLNQEGILHWNH